jgi:virginiamycin B lyase
MKFFSLSNALALLIGSSLLFGCGGDTAVPTIEEYSIDYPNKASIDPSLVGSTHEITYSPFGGDVFWITGPNYGHLVKLGLDGERTYFDLGAGSAPHGVDFDKNGQMFVSLEGLEKLARVSTLTGAIIETYPINVDAHGVGIGPDGLTVWYTGKTDNMIGKLPPNGEPENFPVPTLSSFPIYIKAGPDNNMWFTELTGNKIGRITDAGVITEFPIPTANSRPIAIVPDPQGAGMWFSQEAGNNVAFISSAGLITEYPVPKTRSDLILAGLAFDSSGNLWTQQYVPKNASPSGIDYIVKIRKEALARAPSLLTAADFTFYAVPSTNTVLHRIVEGPDGFMWFTELFADKVGKLNVK